MEPGTWSDLSEDDEQMLLVSDASIEDLVQTLPPGCLFCRLNQLGEEDDE